MKVFDLVKRPISVFTVICFTATSVLLSAPTNSYAVVQKTVEEKDEALIAEIARQIEEADRGRDLPATHVHRETIKALSLGVVNTYEQEIKPITGISWRKLPKESREAFKEHGIYEGVIEFLKNSKDPAKVVTGKELTDWFFKAASARASLGAYYGRVSESDVQSRVLGKSLGADLLKEAPDIGAWYDPAIAKAERIQSELADGSVAELFTYDVTNPGSYSGGYIKVNNVTLVKGQALELEFKGEEKQFPKALKMEIKSKGQMLHVETLTNISEDWQKHAIVIDEDLQDIDEIAIVFEHDKAKPNTKGGIYFKQMLVADAKDVEIVETKAPRAPPAEAYPIDSVTKSVLDKFGITDAVSMHSAEGGYTNPTWLIIDSKGDWHLLKQTRAYQDLSDKTIEFESALNDFIVQANEKTGFEWGLPRIYKTPDNKSYVTEGDDVYFVYEYLEGGEFGNWGLALNRLKSAGSALAELHLILKDFPLNKIQPRNREISAYRNLGGKIKNAKSIKDYLASKTELSSSEAYLYERLPKLIALLEKTESFLPEEKYKSLPRQLVHGDYSPIHLYFKGMNIESMIDWENAYEDARVSDFFKGNYLTYNEETVKNMVEFIANYQMRAEELDRPLSSDEIQAIPYLHLISLVALMASFLTEAGVEETNADEGKFGFYKSQLDALMGLEGVDFTTFENQVQERISEIKEAAKPVLAEEAELTEEGYSKLAQTGVAEDMKVFIRRVLDEMGLEVANEGDLSGFAPWYTNPNIQSLKRMKEELSEAGWVQGKSLGAEDLGALTEWLAIWNDVYGMDLEASVEPHGDFFSIYISDGKGNDVASMFIYPKPDEIVVTSQSVDKSVSAYQYLNSLLHLFLMQEYPKVNSFNYLSPRAKDFDFVGDIEELGLLRNIREHDEMDLLADVVHDSVNEIVSDPVKLKDFIATGASLGVTGKVFKIRSDLTEEQVRNVPFELSDLVTPYEDLTISISNLENGNVSSASYLSGVVMLNLRPDNRFVMFVVGNNTEEAEQKLAEFIKKFADEETPEVPVARGLNILVLDDDRGVRNYMTRAVEYAVEDANFIEAVTGDEAIEKLREMPSAPDLAFLDLRYPGKADSLDVSKLIRNMPGGENAKLIVSSGTVKEDVTPELIEITDDIVMKPMDLDKLEEIVLEKDKEIKGKSLGVKEKRPSTYFERAHKKTFARRILGILIPTAIVFGLGVTILPWFFGSEIAEGTMTVESIEGPGGGTTFWASIAGTVTFLFTTIVNLIEKVHKTVHKAKTKRKRHIDSPYLIMQDMAAQTDLTKMAIIVVREGAELYGFDAAVLKLGRLDSDSAGETQLFQISDQYDHFATEEAKHDAGRKKDDTIELHENSISARTIKSIPARPQETPFLIEDYLEEPELLNDRAKKMGVVKSVSIPIVVSTPIQTEKGEGEVHQYRGNIVYSKINKKPPWQLGLKIAAVLKGLINAALAEKGDIPIAMKKVVNWVFEVDEDEELIDDNEIAEQLMKLGTYFELAVRFDELRGQIKEKTVSAARLLEEKDRDVAMLPFPFMRINEKGVIEDISEEGASFFGYSRSDIRGMKLEELFNPTKTDKEGRTGEQIFELLKQGEVLEPFSSRVFNRRGGPYVDMIVTTQLKTTKGIEGEMYNLSWWGQPEDVTGASLGRKANIKFSFVKTTDHIVQAFREDENRKKLPTATELSSVLGPSNVTILNYYPEVLERLKVKIDEGEFDEVLAKRLDQAILVREDVVAAAARHIVDLFKNDEKLIKLPTAKKLSSDLGPNYLTFSGKYPAITSTLQDHISQEGFDPTLKERLTTAIGFRMKRAVVGEFPRPDISGASLGAEEIIKIADANLHIVATVLLDRPKREVIEAMKEILEVKGEDSLVFLMDTDASVREEVADHLHNSLIDNKYLKVKRVMGVDTYIAGASLGNFLKRFIKTKAPRDLSKHKNVWIRMTDSTDEAGKERLWSRVASAGSLLEKVIKSNENNLSIGGKKLEIAADEQVISNDDKVRKKTIALDGKPIITWIDRPIGVWSEYGSVDHSTGAFLGHKSENEIFNPLSFFDESVILEVTRYEDKVLLNIDGKLYQVDFYGQVVEGKSLGRAEEYATVKNTLTNLEPVKVIMSYDNYQRLSNKQREEYFGLAGLNPKTFKGIVYDAPEWDKPLPNIEFITGNALEANSSYPEITNTIHLSKGETRALEDLSPVKDKISFFKYQTDENGLLGVALLLSQAIDKETFIAKYGLKKQNGFFVEVSEFLHSLVQEFEATLAVAVAA